MPISMISAALVASLVGFGSTVALVLSAAAALGATPAQTASWLLAVSVAKGIGSAGLSAWSRVPVVLAWSTPGAALIAATTGLGMAEAAGAFVLAGLMIAATGLIGPLGRLIARIPEPVAGGMLAGVLLPFCLKLAPAAAESAVLILPMVLAFLAVRRVNPALAVLAALGLGVALAFGMGAAARPDLAVAMPLPVPVRPEFDPAVLVGLGLPLFLVTMASQNLPGFAVLRSAGFEPPVRPALVTTGLLSAAAGLFGGHTVNMAAITAAICLGPEVHPEARSRWRVGLVYGLFWLLLGLAGPLVVAVMAALPTDLVAAVVAIALLAPTTGALVTAFAPAEGRFAAAVTLAVTASGVAVLGIGAAFWGLVAGLLVLAADRIGRKRQG